MKSDVKQYAQFSKCRMDEGYLYKKKTKYYFSMEVLYTFPQCFMLLGLSNRSRRANFVFVFV